MERRLSGLLAAALILLAGCASHDYVGDRAGLLLPDGTREVITTATAGLPIVGNSIRTMNIYKHDPKTGKTEFIWGASTSGQFNMPDLSKVPLGISIP